MQRNIENYLTVFSNAISADVCNSAIDELNTHSWNQHTYHDSESDTNVAINGGSELDISYANISQTHTLMNAVGNCLQQYVDELDFSWFRNMSGYTGIRFNRYEQSSVMSEHCDHIYTMFDGKRKGIPILSVLGILNDDYDGGNLIFWEDNEVITKQGDILIWPSLFLYPHRVEPVTGGTRYSFVSWAW